MKGCEERSPDGLSHDEFAAAGVDQVTGCVEQISVHDGGVPLLILELEPVVWAWEVGDKVEDSLLLGRVPAFVFELAEATSGIMYVGKVLLVGGPANLTHRAVLPHLQAGVLRLRMEVEENSPRSQPSVDLPQGVDHALQVDASQGMSQDSDIEGFGGQLELGDISDPELDLGCERCRSRLYRQPDLVRVGVDG